MSFRRVIATFSLAISVTACSGGLPNAANGAFQPSAIARPDAAKLTIVPNKISLEQLQKKVVYVEEAGYTGYFNTSETVACTQIAKAVPTVGSGPKLKVTYKGLKPGSCSVAYSDSNGHSAKLGITTSK